MTDEIAVSECAEMRRLQTALADEIVLAKYLPTETQRLHHDDQRRQAQREIDVHWEHCLCCQGVAEIRQELVEDAAILRVVKRP